MASLEQRCLQAAQRCADWLVNNQLIKENSADNGRYMAEFIIKKMKVRGYAMGWPTGMATISLLAMYMRTKNKKYLKAAEQAGEYLKSLQVLDAREKRNIGLIREFTPQTNWCHPRDAVSAAWSMLWLGKATNNKEYIERAILFARWFKNNAVKNNYPAWTCFMAKKEPKWLMGSFHGGSPFFSWTCIRSPKIRYG